MGNYFISINIPKDISQTLFIKLKKEDFDEVLFGKSINPESYHLTLRFFGDISLEEVNLIKEKLREINFSKFECFINEIGFFDNKFSGVLWVGLHSEKLHEFVNEIWKTVGSEKRKFKAHITVFRYKKILNRELLNNKIKNFHFDKLSFFVNEFYLMKSNLLSIGSEYEAIQKYELY